ncbi:aromatic acid/H+ symport family MFS transporter [Saccharopolyspora shandongensis]|uniref:MFS transporter n=1 Tax=Saccharopolyspora shandongensis TaxID=418495 RepID=UPI0033CE809A
MPNLPTTTEASGHTRWALVLAWAAVLLEGFDLVVLGSVLPVMLDTEQWGLTPMTASLSATAGLVGMTIGALAIGTVTDIVGRRKALIYSVLIFSVCTALCAVAPSVLGFAFLRFAAGLGLGGCLPTALTIAVENASSGKRNSATTMVMTGYHLGAVLVTLLGIVVLPTLGWRWMFLLCAAPTIVLVPLMLRYLPESEAFSRGTKREHGSGRSLRVVGSLFGPGYARSTVAFWVASFMGLLLVHGLNTWLPEIMRTAGYQLGAALGLLLVLNVGAVIGLFVAGKVADRVGVRPSTISWFGIAAVLIAAMSLKLPGIGVYIVVLIAGCFVFAAQVLLYSYTGQFYASSNRATGIGWTAGVGRLGAISGPMVGGVLLSAGLAYPWGFYAFALVGVVGMLSASLIRRPVAEPSAGVATVPRSPQSSAYAARREG